MRTLNPNSSCMIERKCSKQYLRVFASNTVTGNDEYPLNRKRSADNSDKIVTIQMQNTNIEVDNRWVCLYLPWLIAQYQNERYTGSNKAMLPIL